MGLGHLEVPITARNAFCVGAYRTLRAVRGEMRSVIELTDAPLAERVKYFRQLTQRARRDAQRSRGPLRLAFLRLAQGWEMLADAAQDVMDNGATETPKDQVFPEQSARPISSHDRAF